MPTFTQLMGLGKGALDGSNLVEKDNSRRDRHHAKHRSDRHVASSKHRSRSGHRRSSRKVIYDPSSSSSVSSSSEDSASSVKPAKPSNIREVVLHSSKNRVKDRSKMIGWTLAGYGMSRLAQGGKRGKGDRGTIAELKKRHKPAEEFEGFGAAVIGAAAVYAIKAVYGKAVGDGGKAERKKRQRSAKKHISRAGRH